MAGTHTGFQVELSPVKFSRLSRRGLLLGLSLPQVSTMGGAVLVFVGSLYLGGGQTALWASPVWMIALLVTWVPISGRKAIEWLPVSLHWAWRVLTRQTAYRRRVTVPRLIGTLGLPGDAAAFREYLDPDTGAVMIHDPHHHRLIAVVEVTHPAFVLLDPGEQERRVAGWGRVLATC